MPSHRSDIDGLRALAVLGVILAHASAGTGAHAAGIVGVDVFFVISGFLITRIILDEQAAGRFSLRGFYLRRARRILPALLLVLAVTSVVAWLLMLPWELAEHGSALLASLGFVANLYFQQHTDYFSPAAELQPLIHLWSLAVEEQFYLLYPLLLMALAGTAIVSRRALLLAVLALGSFGLWLWWSHSHPDRAFYGLPARAWQLLLGALIALAPVTRAIEMTNPRLLSAAAHAGMLLLAAGLGGAAFWLLPALPLAGSVLLASAGTALLLACGRHGQVCHRLLSLPPLVWMGLISYSAYLWHQPVFVTMRLLGADVAATPQLLLALALVLALAGLSWHYVEQPFRRRSRAGAASVPRLRWLAAPALACAAFGVSAHVQQGQLGRHPPELAHLHGALRSSLPCQQHPDHGALQLDGCLPQAARGQANLAIWGDSHALALAQGLHAAGQADALVYTRAGCAPVVGLEEMEQRPGDCDSFNRAALQAIRDSRVSSVILAARWPLYVQASPYDNGMGGREAAGSITPSFPSAADSDAATPEVRAELLAQALGELIDELNADGREVQLLLPWPEFGWHVPNQAWQAQRLRWQSTLQLDAPSLPRAQVEQRQQLTRQALQALHTPARPHLTLIDPLPSLCTPTECQSGSGSSLWYWDDDHLSVAGVAVLTRQRDGLRP